MVLDDLPEAAVIRGVGRAFIHQDRRAVEERAVDHVGVARDPAHVGRAPEEVVAAEVEDILVGRVGVDHVAAHAVHDALGFAGGAGSVEQEEHLVGFLLDRFALVGDLGGGLMVPDVAAGLHDAARVGLARVALEDEHVGAGRAVLHAFVDRLLQREELPAAVAAVHRDDRLRLRVVDAVADGFGREAAEHHRVDDAEAGAGEDRHRELGHHRHVDRDGVAAPEAHALEHVGEAADFGEQLAVGDAADLDGLAVGGGLAFVDDRDLVAEALGDLRVEAVVGDVGLAVHEPAEERLLGFVDHLGPRLEPGQLLGFVGPEAVGVLDRALVEGVIAVHALDPGFGDERGAGREDLLVGAEAFGAGLLDVVDLFVGVGVLGGGGHGFTFGAKDQIDGESHQDGERQDEPRGVGDIRGAGGLVREEGHGVTG